MFKTLIGLGHSELTVLALGNTTHAARPAAEAGPLPPSEPSGGGASGQHTEAFGDPGEWRTGAIRPLSARPSGMCPLLSTGDGQAHAAEQYRIFRTKLVKLFPTPFRVVITSPGVGDGKTLTAVNLAVAMALRSQERTLLVDADLRRAGVNRILQVPLEPGLADVLAGRCRLEEALIATSGLCGLYVLPAGKVDGNPTELLDGSQWQRIANVARRHFAHVIVDSPPVEVVADYDLIAEACEGVVLVVRPDHTDRTLTLRAIERLGPKLAGVLINAEPEWFLRKKSSHHDYYYYKTPGPKR